MAKQNEECDFATVYYNKIELIFVEELKNLYGIGDSSEVEGLSKKREGRQDRVCQGDDEYRNEKTYFRDVSG